MDNVTYLAKLGWWLNNLRKRLAQHLTQWIYVYFSSPCSTHQHNSNIKQIHQANRVHNKMAMLRIKRYLKVGGKKCWRVTRAGNVKRKQNYSTVCSSPSRRILFNQGRTQGTETTDNEALGLKHLGSILDSSTTQSCDLSL